MSNVLGRRSWYKYKSDAGVEYSVLMDDTLAAVVGAELNDSLPNLPRRFEARMIHLESQEGDRKVRKSLICPEVTSALYARSTSTAVVIGTSTWALTGRTGEKQTFASNRDEKKPVDAQPALPPAG